MNIFLIGFMGSGKSSLGKKLSTRLDRDFVDLDSLIEEREGKSISSIFSEKGEAYFRKVESEILHSLNVDKQSVVSLGGGACCSDENWNFLENNGLIIYLKEKPEVLLGRLRVNKSKRPLIANLDDNDLTNFIQEKLDERSIYYEKAHFIYEKEKCSFAFLVKQIENYVGNTDFKKG